MQIELNTSPAPNAISISPIIAYRSWRMSCDGQLRARHMAYEWPASSPAEGNPDGVAPSGWLTGIYALRNIAPAHIARDLDDDDIVWGAVALWGRVAEHTLGLRAQYGYPQVLYTHRLMTASTRERVQASARRYGCDVAEYTLPEYRADVHVRAQPGGRRGRDRYVAVTLAPPGVSVPYTLRSDVLARRGIIILYFGDGYSRYRGARSLLGLAIASATRVADIVNGGASQWT